MLAHVPLARPYSLAFFAALLLAAGLRADASEGAHEHAQPRNPAATLADGLLPDEAARAMTVPEGFRVQLAASEPNVHQPVAMAFDHRGRLWVAEAHTYPTRAPEGQGRDKILILDDTDGDGVFDSFTTFIEGLNLVSGLEVGFGGVWVGAAPYLLFIPDRDGDDRPDGPPEVLLDGFGYQDTHETLNAFNWGPDGWLYGCHGVFTHSRVGKPGTPDKQRTPMNAAVWRYHPLKHEFEVFAWGTSNPWGVDFNDHGQAFATACVIPHLFHIIQGARYQRQAGRHFDDYVYGELKTIADHAHYSGNIADHAWWGKEPELPQGTSEAGGGHAHCGAMIYLGDNWPARYRNQIFMNNIHGNRVNNDILVRKGSGYVGSHGPDFLFANDKWFRGINLRYGPDGTVYLIDWYDRNACHRVNPEIWDRTNGRIYRVSYGDVHREPIDLSRLGSDELVRLQTHENDWYVRVARRLLQQRGADPAVHAALVELLRSAETTRVRLRALWALHVTEGLTPELTSELLADESEYLRAWTIQLELEDRRAEPQFVERLTELAVSDPSPVVRLYLASALQRMERALRWPILEALAGHVEDAEDANLPLMYWYAAEPLVRADPSRALTLAQSTPIAQLRQFLLRRAAADNSSLGQVAALLSDADAEQQREILDQMLLAFEGRVNVPMPDEWRSAYDVVAQSSSESVRQRADQVAVILGDRRIFPKMRTILADHGEALDARRRALEILVRGRDGEAAEAMHAALATPELRGEVIRALASLDHPETARAILAVYGELNTEQRRDAVATLVARPASAFELMAAVRQGRVPRTDVHAYHIRQLLEFRNSELELAIKQAWGEFRATSAEKKQRIAELKRQLGGDALATADPGRGRAVFDRTCASCHRLFGEGGDVGPDITGSNRADLDYILENIIDPSAVVGQDYRMTVLNTVDGRVISGIVQRESDSALSVRTLNDTVVVAKEDIEDRQLSELSLMPEGQLDEMSSEEVRNLIAYLASPTQVAPRGPQAPIDEQTGRVEGALEGEAMKVLGTTAGITSVQHMAPFTRDRWSSGAQLWWTGGEPGARLDLALPIEQTGSYELEVVLTRAHDYGVVQLLLDGVKVGEPIDLYNAPDVLTTGVLTIAPRQLDMGEHTFSIQILGAHPKAVPAYMVGLDYVRVKPSE